MKFIKIISHLTVFVLFVLILQEPALARSFFHPNKLVEKKEQFNVPTIYSSVQVNTNNTEKTGNAADINWRDFYADPFLITLIETALTNNQEYNIFLQDIEIAKNEVKARQGEYLPKVGLGLGAEAFGLSDHSHEGVVDQVIDRNGLSSPHTDMYFGPNLTWEVDIWRKLRNAKDAAAMRVLAQNEGRNFLISRLVAEIASNYYELMALDNSLEILDENIVIQNKAFLKMQALKEYAKSNQLAVNRFEAQLLKTKSQRYEIQQKIVEKENRLRFLTGIYDSKPILRDSDKFMAMQVNELETGVPTQLLENRPDIRQAEYAIQAAKLDLASVKASLYPSLSIRAGLGFLAFHPGLLLNPKSLIFNAMGDIMAPLINRKALVAQIQIADSYQSQMVFNYEQTLLQAYTDVLNQMSKIQKYQQAFETKQKEVVILDNSIDIANNLFQYAKADYVEVLLTQEEKLNAQQELLEIKTDLVRSKVDLYRALGGGWR